MIGEFGALLRAELGEYISTPTLQRKRCNSTGSCGASVNSLDMGFQTSVILEGYDIDPEE